MSIVDRLMSYIAPVVLSVAAVLVIVFFINSTNQVDKDNNVYVRYIACALSVEPSERSKSVISNCWDHVIEEAGIDVHRYDEIEDNHHWLHQ
jgi:hypothetical protein